MYKKTDGTEVVVSNPAEMPDQSSVQSIEEPYVKASIMVPNEYVGSVMDIYQRKRGTFVTMDYLDELSCKRDLRNATFRNHLRFL